MVKKAGERNRKRISKLEQQNVPSKLKWNKNIVKRE